MADHHSSSNASSVGGDLDEASAYVALSRILLADRPLSKLLDGVALLAKQVLPAAPKVSVTLVRSDHAETSAFTGALALQTRRKASSWPRTTAPGRRPSGTSSGPRITGTLKLRVLAEQLVSRNARP